MLVEAQASAASDRASGPSSPGSLAKWDRATSSWRTSQASVGRGIGDVRGDLASLGYDSEGHCMPASAIGAPHIRDRIWIVAYPDDCQHNEQKSEIRAANGWTKQRWSAWGLEDLARMWPTPTDRGRREQGDVGEAPGAAHTGQSGNGGALGDAKSSMDHGGDILAQINGTPSSFRRFQRVRKSGHPLSLATGDRAGDAPRMGTHRNSRNRLVGN